MCLRKFGGKGVRFSGEDMADTDPQGRGESCEVGVSNEYRAVFSSEAPPFFVTQAPYCRMSGKVSVQSRRTATPPRKSGHKKRAVLMTALPDFYCPLTSRRHRTPS